MIHVWSDPTNHGAYAGFHRLTRFIGHLFLVGVLRRRLRRRTSGVSD